MPPGISYTAHGWIALLPFGNGRRETWSYNNRLQPSSVQLETQETPASLRSSSIASPFWSMERARRMQPETAVNLLVQKIVDAGLDLAQTYAYL